MGPCNLSRSASLRMAGIGAEDPLELDAVATASSGPLCVGVGGCRGGWKFDGQRWSRYRKKGERRELRSIFRSAEGHVTQSTAALDFSPSALSTFPKAAQTSTLMSSSQKDL